ncbi:hypothetical protein B0A48_06243 [Cryoendolithus antarcticus]|uniref:DUF4149 domain-containing protein n=1 Tax=Cryoendolithus antarcticus TaxID=1507870 RepID=A0A1V8TAE0_9PEZI|nr:hypothetical protein B0A48_06243 [Cryoendolithus antarcticus]
MSTPAFNPTTLAQLISSLLPAFFAGTIFGYNYIFIPPLLLHTDDRTLALQWLSAYQFGARYVRPLATASTLSSAYLLFSVLRSSNAELTMRLSYLLGFISLPLLLAYTLMIMEPGVNGALKYKSKLLIGDKVKFQGRAKVGEEHETASEASKEWAEKTGVRELLAYGRKPSVGKFSWVNFIDAARM